MISKATQTVTSLVGLGPAKPASPDWNSLVVTAAQDANLNSPVALDIVFVKDAALVEVLATTPSSKWFDMKADTLRSFPGGLSLISLELVPGQSVKYNAQSLQSHKALAVFVFAGYPTPGEHRERLLLTAHDYLLQLFDRDFKAVEPLHDIK